MRHAPAGWTASIGTALLLGFGGARVPARADETPGPPITGELATAVEPDLAALSTPDFFKALEQRLDWHSSGKDELWLVHDRCQAELDAEHESEPSRQQLLRARSCGRAGEALAQATEGSERTRLLDDFDTIPTSSPIRDALLRGLLASALAEKLRALEAGAGAARPPLPATELPEVPEGLAAASSELQNAWRLKTALARAYNGRVEAIQEERGRVSVHREEGAFHAAITDFLRGRVGAPETIVNLSRFVWGGGCGMGSQALFGPQNRTLLLAFLATGDHEAAAGAIVYGSILSDFLLPEGGSDDALEEGWEARFLERLGFDWERIFLGLVLDGDQRAAAALARRGSDRAARLLFEARTVSPLGSGTALADQDGYLHALAALVTPTDRCRDYGTSSSLDLKRAEDAEGVGADLEADVLELLASHVQPGGGRSEAETAAHLLVKACRPESLSAFQTMTRSVYSRVREAGALALRSHGERAPRKRENPPIVFTVTVDGAPLGERRVEWALERRSGGGYLSSESSAATTVNSRLLLGRDPFLDPKAAVDTVTLSTGHLSAPGDLWFSIALPRPESLDRPTPVRLETQSLTIRCPEAGAAGLRLSLAAPESRWGAYAFFTILDDVPLSGTAPLVFPHLQRGSYQLVVRGPAGSWESDRITLGADPVEITCGPLEPPAEPEFDGLTDETPPILRF